MQETDLKFFTNEANRDLYSRFSSILKSNTQFFDVLVGYFRSSGFFKLYKSLETVEKIRILIGLNVNKFTIDIIDKSKDELNYIALSSTEAKNSLEDEVINEFESIDSSLEIEKGVQIFIDWLKSKKIELRLYTKSPIHAKVYIMRKDPIKVPDMFGSVITGSSNFSKAGLVNNLEFNVELKDSPDVKFALNRFEKLWNDSEDISEVYIETVEQKTWMKDDITPYQLYLKTLYEFFKEEINSDKENFDTLLPEGYMKLQYQKEAVIQSRKKLDAYNGVFISDVVGLGKTYICAMLANSFKRDTYKLFICPPVLVDYWRNVLQEFDVSRCDVESLGKLDKIINNGTDKYTYIFIDEAHRFRNSDTESFTQLHQICCNKKVVLISATPINNYTSDIENQIYLFQSKQNGTINGIKNIEGFFNNLNYELNKKVKGSPEYKAQLRKNSELIRDKLIREIMIRRTRSEIQKYYKNDLEKQGLKFPNVGSPEKIIYEFDDKTNKIFTETINIIKNFKYTRYTPLIYLKNNKAYASMLIGQKNMGGFMKGILIKRLESSFYAFCMTLKRFIESYRKFIDMVNTGDVYISKKVNVYDLLDNGDTEKLMYLIENEDVMKFKTSDFNDKFISNLESDLSQLCHLQDLWSNIKIDPKLNVFKNQLTTNDKIKNNKIIVFTESTETAEYLYKNLKDIFDDRIVHFSGKSKQSLKIDIEDSFNPKNKNKNNDKYDILITTDVLAEGINLHRANILINYDLPWNPTRIMQRVGRINRVGTSFDRIYVFNFFPTAQSSYHMPLEERILEKLQSFHDTLGEDFKYISDDEEVTTQKLFSDLSKNLDTEEDEEINPELKYLSIIRDIRDNDSKLFSQIKRLPIKAKSSKTSSLIENETTVTFIRKGALKTFFSTNDDEVKYLTFMEAIKFIETNPDVKRIPINNKYYDYLKSNSNAFDNLLIEENKVSTEKTTITGNNAKIIKTLKGIKKDDRITDNQEENINKLISCLENGDITSKICKDISKVIKNATDILELYYEIFKLVPDIYFQGKNNKKLKLDGKKEIILSCYIKGDK